MTIEPSLIEYPCNFPIKVFGKAHDQFVVSVTEVIVQYDPGFSASNIDIRNSKTARYVSLTCNVRALSREQLDAIYLALCAHPLVTMAL